VLKWVLCSSKVGAKSVSISHFALFSDEDPDQFHCVGRQQSSSSGDSRTSTLMSTQPTIPE
jgi:hypothetical protein